MHLESNFVETIPEKLEDGVLYVSIPGLVAIHKCACGCARDVVTPISAEHGWILIFDGENISLSPSIGNWSFPCRSHYWIRNGEVKWCKEERPSKKKKRPSLWQKWFH